VFCAEAGSVRRKRPLLQLSHPARRRPFRAALRREPFVANAWKEDDGGGRRIVLRRPGATRFTRTKSQYSAHGPCPLENREQSRRLQPDKATRQLTLSYCWTARLSSPASARRLALSPVRVVWIIARQRFAPMARGGLQCFHYPPQTRLRAETSCSPRRRKPR
jgi:hypothetical protein